MIFWLEVKKKKTNEHSKIQQKPADSNRMVTVDTVEKSWKNLLYCRYVKDIAKLKRF